MTKNNQGSIEMAVKESYLSCWSFLEFVIEVCYFFDSLYEISNKSGGPNKHRVGTFFMYVDEKT